MFFGIIDFDTNRLTYARAGHPYPFLIHRAERTVRRLEAKGDVVGLIEDISVQEEQVEIRPGDRLFTYSDGLFEVWNRDDAIFGMDRLQELLGAGLDENGDTLIANLIQQRNDFSAHEDLDDVAILMVELL